MAAYVTQYNKRYILSTFDKIEIFAFSIRRFNKLFNDTKFMNIEVILLKYELNFSFIFFIFYTLFCSLSQNKPGRQDVPFVVLGNMLSPCSRSMFEIHHVSCQRQ